MIGQLGGTAAVLLSLALILFAGAVFARLAGLAHLPDVTGYILAGILIGPSVLNLIPAGIIDGMSFLSDLALAFIAFSVGKFFKIETLRETGLRVILITMLESMLAGVLVTLVMRFFFHFSFDFSLLLGAIATATAPASTMMTIGQYHAKGPFVNTLLQVVALDDVVCLLLFSVITALLSAEGGGNLTKTVVLPLVFNLAAILLGALLGFLLSLLAGKIKRDKRLIVTITMLLLLSALCAAVDISPLLSCMVFSAFYINISHDKKLHKRIGRFTPPVMSMFFVVSGMNLDLGALRTIGLAGVIYFLVRIVGKYAGAWLGCFFTRPETATRRWLGFALVPQAGVAIGLAFLVERMLPPSMGNQLLTLILASSVLYELIGPALAKVAIRRACVFDSDTPLPPGLSEDLIPESDPGDDENM